MGTPSTFFPHRGNLQDRDDAIKMAQDDCAAVCSPDETRNPVAPEIDRTSFLTGSQRPQVKRSVEARDCCSFSVGAKGYGLEGTGTVVHHMATSSPPEVPQAAILALLTEKTLSLAARRAGVGERTLRRWLNDDTDFQAEYAAARQATFSAGINRVQALTGKAVDTLEELLSTKEHPHVRLGAARTVIEVALHRHDEETIMKKLDEIETAQRRHGIR